MKYTIPAVIASVLFTLSPAYAGSCGKGDGGIKMIGLHVIRVVEVDLLVQVQMASQIRWQQQSISEKLFIAWQ